MRRAREVARELGGLRACNSYTKLYLAIFGSTVEALSRGAARDDAATDWLPFNIYAMSAWSRAIVVPLSMIWAYKPHCEVPGGALDPELDVNGSARHRAAASTPREQALGDVLRGRRHRPQVGRGLGLRPLRRLALERARHGFWRGSSKSDGLGAIFPPIINTIIAFAATATQRRSRCSRPDRRAREARDRGGRHAAAQPCKSPVWDTSRRSTRCSSRRRGRRPGSARRRLAARSRGHRAGRLAGQNPTSRSAAGTSSTPTSSIPTATTRPRS